MCGLPKDFFSIDPSYGGAMVIRHAQEQDR